LLAIHGSLLITVRIRQPKLARVDANVERLSKKSALLLRDNLRAIREWALIEIVSRKWPNLLERNCAYVKSCTLKTAARLMQTSRRKCRLRPYHKKVWSSSPPLKSVNRCTTLMDTRVPRMCNNKYRLQAPSGAPEPRRISTCPAKSWEQSLQRRVAEAYCSQKRSDLLSKEVMLQ
jgi:hypothetical protein